MARCQQCGAETAGFYGDGRYVSSFYCKSCWSQWSHVEDQEELLRRDLGLLEAPSLLALGKLLASRLTPQLPLRRTRECVDEGRWLRAAEAGRKAWQELSSWDFVRGAEEVLGQELWSLLTIYEVQVASQLPRRARAAGCSGVACSGGLLGQTEEVDVPSSGLLDGETGPQKR